MFTQHHSPGTKIKIQLQLLKDIGKQLNNLQVRATELARD